MFVISADLSQVPWHMNSASPFWRSTGLSGAGAAYYESGTDTFVKINS